MFYQFCFQYVQIASKHNTIVYPKTVLKYQLQKTTAPICDIHENKSPEMSTVST